MIAESTPVTPTPTPTPESESQSESFQIRKHNTDDSVIDEILKHDNHEEDIQNLYQLHTDLNEKTFNAAKEIFENEKNDDFSTIANISQLYQYFDNFNAKHRLSSPKLELKRSSKLNESIRSFLKNRVSFQDHLYESFEQSNDENWLKRISKMPKFIIPQKYNSFDIKINAIGIDLGTSYCCVAVNRENRIEAAAIDNTGERILPSYVAFDEKMVKCGKVVVERLGTFSKSTIFDSKRIIGKNFDEIEIDPTWPFNIKKDNGNVKLIVNGHSGESLKSPEEIASILLLHMKSKAEEFQGRGITTVVITIPASFTEKQKDATIVGGKLAGWQTINLLPEPVAAAFAYFIDRQLPENSNILLFDFGGGTLDICIFQIKNSVFKIIRNKGDANIGGRKFDNIIFEYFRNELLSKHEIDIETNERKKYKLMLQCQNVKHNLSIRNDDQIHVDDYDSSKDGPPIMLTRQRFENLTEDLINDIKNLLKSATDDLQHPIEKVLHVGGSSRMPLIKKILQDLFPHAEHCIQEQPEEVVAIGAAYYSYHLAWKQTQTIQNREELKW